MKEEIKPLCEICAQPMSDDDTFLGYSRDLEEGGQLYSHFDCVVKWKTRPGTSKSFLYFGDNLMGVVRYWGGGLSFSADELWSAYSSEDGQQTYHPTEEEAKKELARRSNIYI